MKVIYFHGFASSPQGSKVDLLCQVGFSVAAPTIDIDPDIAEPYLIEFIRQEAIKGIESNDRKIILVGTSLGGYWAARMGELFEGAAVLINPAMHPEASLKKFIGPYTNYATGEQKILTDDIVAKYANYPSAGSNRYRAYFIATRDTVIETPDEGSLFEYDSADHRGMSFFGDVIEYLKMQEKMIIGDSCL
jgi:predicted esterase YcpF (UPF0227 family)